MTPPRPLDPGTIALLLARGCPPEHLTLAHNLLRGRVPPADGEAMIRQVDDVIALAALEASDR